jgi:8-oxo-dGTP diphosphatase
VTSPQIELIVRAVITDGPRVLLAQPAGSDWFFLPGGHVEGGETAATALRRELEEELGVRRVRVGGVLAVAEVRYADERGEHHELDLVHRVAVEDAVDGSKEEHLTFRWVDRSELEDVEIRPAAVAELLRGGLDGPETVLLTEGWG